MWNFSTEFIYIKLFLLFAGEPKKRKIQNQCIRKKPAEIDLWIITLIQNVPSVQSMYMYTANYHIK